MANDFYLLKEIVIPDEIKSIYALEQLVFIDIETTGFSHRNSFIINLGLLSYKNDWQLQQFWAADEAEEKALLNAFLDFDQPDMIYICYNGRSFDFPFIKSRLKHHRLSDPRLDCRIIDFMPLGRHFARMRSLPSYTLKSIELALGLVRHHDLSGQEVVEAFQEYRYTGNVELKTKILAHNAQDIIHMPHLLDVLTTESGKDVTSLLPLVLQIKSRSMALLCRWTQSTLELTGDSEAAIELAKEVYSGYHLNMNAHRIAITLPLVTMHIEEHLIFRLDWSLCFPERSAYEDLPIENKLKLVLKSNEHVHLENIIEIIQEILGRHN